MSTNPTREALSSSLVSYYESLASAQFLAAESFAESIAAALAEAAAAAATALYVVFYYDLDSLKTEIYMRTHYKAKNVKSQDQAAKSRLDDLSITEDEEEMLDSLLKYAARDIYKLLGPYGKDISGGFVHSPAGTLPIAYNVLTEYDEADLFYVGTQLYYTIADATPAGTDPTDTDWFTPVGEHYNTYHKIIYTLNYNTNMDDSMITALNDDIQDCLVKNVILNWYKVIKELDMLPLSEGEYDEAKRQVWNIPESLMQDPG